MSNSTTTRQPAYQLLLHPDEVPVAATAMRLFISDEAHQARVHQLGHEVLGVLQAAQEDVNLTVTLDPEQMKILYSAVRLLFDDLQREQASQREILRSILNKLPDERTMRAIKIDAQAPPAEADPIVDDQAA